MEFTHHANTRWVLRLYLRPVPFHNKSIPVFLLVRAVHIQADDLPSRRTALKRYIHSRKANVCIAYDDCFFSPQLLAGPQDTSGEIPCRLRDALEAIRRQFPSVVFESIHLDAGVVQLLAPNHTLAALEKFISEETFGSVELDEDHSVRGA